MSIRLSRRAALISSAVAAGGAALPATGWTQTSADTRSDEEIAAAADAWVQRCMAAWPEQPAVSRALVRDGKTVLA